MNSLNDEFDAFKNKFGDYERMFVDDINVLKEENNEYLRSIIEILPKKDLADLTHFLIMIPSAKRRFSFDLNSVGGDIDVCLMTKVDFEWFDYKI